MPSIDLGSVVGPTGATGATGPQGIQGPQGLQGPPGYGVIPGGAENSFLAKNSAVDYDTKWMTLPQIGSELVKADNPVGAALSGKASNPNLLDNWYFSDPVNQREQTEYTGDGYTVDRWRQTGSISATIGDNKIVFNCANNDYSNFAQMIENPSQYIGKVLTFSALGRAISGSPSLFVPYHGVSPFNQEISVVSMTFVYGSAPDENTSELAVQLWANGVASSFEVIATKLELGGHQTLAHQDEDGNWVLNDPPPNKALELLKCQRYYSKDVLYFSNAQDSNGWAIFTFNYPTMRTAPAITGTADETNASGALTVWRTSPSGAIIAVSGGASTGEGIYWYGSIERSADL